MTEEELYADIAVFFLINDYQWNIDGVKTVPTAEDIKTAVERAKVLLDEVGGGTLTVGHLIVDKTEADKNVYDVYVHMGSIGE